LLASVIFSARNFSNPRKTFPRARIALRKIIDSTLPRKPLGALPLFPAPQKLIGTKQYSYPVELSCFFPMFGIPIAPSTAPVARFSNWLYLFSLLFEAQLLGLAPFRVGFPALIFSNSTAGFFSSSFLREAVWS
jgi:hypothetical protein